MSSKSTIMSASTTTSCIVCGTADTKYKCPGCKALSCSLPCFKAHGLECSSSISASTKTNINTNNQNVEHEASGTTLGSGVRTGDDTATATATTTTVTADANEKKDSFNTTDIQALFVKYPGLKAKLGSIYEGTLDPNSEVKKDRNRDTNEDVGAGGASSTAAGPRTGRVPDRRYERAWNPEKGFERGLSTLREALDTAGPEAEGLEEFLKLVGGKGGER